MIEALLPFVEKATRNTEMATGKSSIAWEKTTKRLGLPRAVLNDNGS
ncbi:MAG: hypothetical protein WDZ42_00505 [Candidatus Saccharimonadales bacterium]